MTSVVVGAELTFGAKRLTRIGCHTNYPGFSDSRDSTRRDFERVARHAFS
jgi:hypothetical protein